ncbi:MAG TPA: GYD domain-containing protein [Pseudonocardiaceae bacterium]|nr:GYD domain-containing protein [Pseudonocardiaceae bacterium]
MSKYVIFFSYTPQAWASMIEKPSDRLAAVRAAAEPLGVTVDSLYFMFGEWDGFLVADAPDSDAAAAIAIAVNSTGAFRAMQTHPLIEPEHLAEVLATSSTGVAGYQPPGT